MALPANSPSSNSTAIAEVRPYCPTDLGWNPMFPVELAMKTAPVRDVCAAYGVDKEMFEAMLEHPMFQKAYEDAVDMLAKEGMSFKLKSKMIAEDALKKVHTLIHDKDTPNSVVADMIKSTVRWAGYEQKGGEAGSASNNMQININLG